MKKTNKHEKAMRAKEKRIRVLNDKDADTRNIYQEKAAETGNRDFRDMAEAKNNAIMKRDSLHAPGYKTGGKVTSKKCKHQSI